MAQSFRGGYFALQHGRNRPVAKPASTWDARRSGWQPLYVAKELMFYSMVMLQLMRHPIRVDSKPALRHLNRAGASRTMPDWAIWNPK
jgi:hypothetical protein